MEEKIKELFTIDSISKEKDITIYNVIFTSKGDKLERVLFLDKINKFNRSLPLTHHIKIKGE